MGLRSCAAGQGQNPLAHPQKNGLQECLNLSDRHQLATPLLLLQLHEIRTRTGQPRALVVEHGDLARRLRGGARFACAEGFQLAQHVAQTPAPNAAVRLGRRKPGQALRERAPVDAGLACEA